MSLSQEKWSTENVELVAVISCVQVRQLGRIQPHRFIPFASVARSPARRQIVQTFVNLANDQN
jgi:hypothetical protein